MGIRYSVSRPSLTGAELAYVSDAINSGWISAHGSHVRRFEEEFAQYNGVAHGVACSSGTAALTLALRALGIGPGDEVIVPEMTFIASAWAVTYTGATPVFVDCRDDLNIDPDLIEEKITPRTRAIMPVHVNGRRCAMDRIMDIAFEYNLRVVEDFAEAHGIKPVGDVACYSLFANKIITSGEGGICLTDDARLARQMSHLGSMAFTKDRSYLHKTIGYNFRMTALQGAVALAQAERIDEILDVRKEIGHRYDEGLAGIDGITLMPARDVLWMYDLLATDRDALMEFLKDDGIETRYFFQPMSKQPMYHDPVWPSLNATRFSQEGLYLPTYTDLSAEDQDFIVGRVREFYEAG
ncbi:DegT/DnrJ/EryC1/StrS family aminotransferase [Streptomyces paludis]|uniref:DegT/DnrJ/EryC1/StrS aminotransferase family protein n=1 Tax=Streptomyces paludis TaxID=2282738 RepID=A0A345HYZ3_9ACTN|nr:DegT/DnrJ/EryC1/StrS aminotransferase family protein [Streptomyces paludis]AXG81917.1 DegT/DnrJ/EryC1/StrS aminotransferase family protein [Streptomyces paludis]